jgi:RimJ/RimL family protein N-acetyltransferase
MRLVEMDPAGLGRLIEGAAPEGLALPPGGVEAPEVLAILRDSMRGGARTWAMAEGGEAVGLCGTKAAPRGGAVEIGYGVAASRRRRGHATAGVAALLAVLRAEGVAVAAAETEEGNAPSERVLARCGFRSAGRREGPAGGVRLWWRAL